MASQFSQPRPSAVFVQTEDFDVGMQLQQMAGEDGETGAIASFTGLVRGSETRPERHNTPLVALDIEHYPGMTEKSLQAIVAAAQERWPLQGVRVIHRIGRLAVGEQIVLVACASAHRQAAFEACQYIMDYLKNDAPFWKKAIFSDSEAWVDAKESDTRALDRW